jgi:hypothetical protein
VVIGVMRDHLGSHEDRFFATVFLGSGLLFLAMTFSAAAVASGMIASYAIDPAHLTESDVYTFGRALISAIFNIFAIRMGGVFMVSSGTIWARSKAMPRWLVFLTYALALILLVVSAESLSYVDLSSLVFVISVYILRLNCILLSRISILRTGKWNINKSHLESMHCWAVPLERPLTQESLSEVRAGL